MIRAMVWRRARISVFRVFAVILNKKNVANWLGDAAIYWDRRLLAILFLGFTSGLPLALTASTLGVWLTEAGTSKAAIGAFALVGLPYTFKFLWSPLIDQLPIPILTRFLGRRRSWIIITQILLMLSLIGLGATTPSTDPGWTAIFALIVAFCSASQDIVIDAFRVDVLDQKTYGAGAATIVFGYRIGMLVSGAGALYLASLFSWGFVYNCMASLIGVGLITALMTKEPVSQGKQNSSRAKPEPAKIANWLHTAVIRPFTDFTGRQNWMMILLFITLYKLGDAFVFSMSNPFYIEIGFSKIEIANVTKIFGFIATIMGGFLGGIVVSRMGIMRALLICGLFQLASNLIFAVQALVGHHVGMLVVTIAIENITGGMGTAALVAFLSSLCHTNYSATQYALLSSFMAVGRTVLSSGSGAIAQSMNWSFYFIFSTLMAIPALVILLWLQRQRLRADEAKRLAPAAFLS